ncbi:MAG: hypothetical protein JWR77_2668 [Rhizorhabdus sp.]|nr:hypothetical protein [Rhizorhabdus sp.]
MASFAIFFNDYEPKGHPLRPLPAIFPDHVAPTVRSLGAQRELTMARWGMPTPPQFPGISTNIRNVPSPCWRRWLWGLRDVHCGRNRGY